jgi:hypothetical protein
VLEKQVYLGVSHEFVGTKMTGVFAVLQHVIKFIFLLSLFLVFFKSIISSNHVNAAYYDADV